MNNRVEKMRYQKNSISFYLTIISVVFNSLYMVNILGSLVIVPDIHIGIDIVINILFMLFVFLGSEKVRVYSKKWSIYIIIIGVLSILRIYYIPYRLYYIVKYNQVNAIDLANYQYLIVLLVLTGVFLISAGVIALIKSIKLCNHLHEVKLKGE